MTLHLANEAAHSFAATQHCRLKLEVTNRISIEQSYQANLFTLLAKLTGHLKGNGAAERTTGDEIWTLRLDLSHLFDIVRRHLFNADEWFLLTIESYRLEGIERLIRSQVTRKIIELQHVA